MIGKILRDTLLPLAVVASLMGTMTPAQAAPKTLMLYGDSLMAGYGLSAEEGFATQLRKRLEADGYEVEIINASVSGDTSAAALARIDWSLAERPDAVLLGLGGNDMLRGLPPRQLSENLRSILTRLRDENIPALLLGMRASPNLGAGYVEAFDSTFPKLAAEFEVPLYPFFLEGVALDPALNQADRIHPNAKGVRIMVEGVLPAVKRLLDQ